MFRKCNIVLCVYMSDHLMLLHAFIVCMPLYKFKHLRNSVSMGLIDISLSLYIYVIYVFVWL